MTAAFSPHTSLLSLAVLWLVTVQAACVWIRRSTLPASLSDEEFWSLSTSLSEPAGTFTHSENLVSNEAHFAHTIRRLARRGGVYIGVGPEQNFSFITRLRPEMAFIIDIRRENRNLHLMYKALFEMSSRIGRSSCHVCSLANGRPASSRRPQFRTSSRRTGPVRPAAGLYHQSIRLIRDRLVDTHKFPLSSTDMEWITHALEAFYTDGPDIHYGRSLPR